jgi:exodeoxyribonuclease VII small subunit
LKDKDLKKLSYEEAVKRLEEIVQLLENAEISLEESLALFQEGIALSSYCREKLAEIEYRVEYLLKQDQQSFDQISLESQSVQREEDEL